MKKRLIVVIAAVLLLSATVLGACSPASDSGGSDAASSAAGSSAAASSAEGSAAGGDTAGKEIVFVPPSMQSPFYAGIISGAQPYAEELGYKFTVMSPSKQEDPAEQVKIVEDLVQRGVAGIALCALDDTAIVAAVRKANDAGIPVVEFNTLTKLQDCEVYGYSGYDQWDGGKRLAQWVNEISGGKAKVGLILGLPGFHSNEREGGFREQCEEYPGIEIIATGSGEFAREPSLNAATTMLSSYPEIEIFVGLNDEIALGAAQACRNAGRDDIKTIGLDGNPNVLEAIKGGEVTASLHVDPMKQGYNAVVMLDEALNGVPIEEGGKMMILEPFIVDKSNVDEWLAKVSE
ncbi:MAG: sugar ABC transporter substrate-binding protein [Clostridiales Family XIII bacterium]|nr:sugar ABC transporter substrate-binding protein [Clostridiales Family XIII bacterium]